MRLFFACFPPAPIRNAIGAFQKELQNAVADPGVRWTRHEQFHFTVRFLGEIAEPVVPRLVEAATRVCTEQPTFSAALGSLELLPNSRTPHTLVLGLRIGLVEMATLARALDKAFRGLDLGIAPENRPFRAHLTLARMKNPRAAEAVLPLLQRSWQRLDQIPSFMVESCTLVRSELRPDGPIYTPLAECLLQHSAEKL
ncbi:2'-5' RNA ligase [Chthonomonas calidirosea]|uniref:RNA 2',3'-cyclic phosphodiesterase n=1 Tax=Chthonomonas calidirosea (strain DSM 23976 / ICMP 18418 / T49) TaxID=1303518 RepID=S0EV91_CHTCT|nr:RNA 2',3'-cyclic phosphodiesterase [Chthonomonas calidirosea]CCW35685.1 2'-5' RNA ligase [Chthonomonas calidirosea T49]CEK18525.1 2'-5' RNA ligase [Chthonomonas calidirosea]CEK18527.1 2'-5' RNA ligase [Chthonomonas calidirosea]CEK19537.1 2'-5' RNA ligase [Chthonomonas calidirosea]